MRILIHSNAPWVPSGYGKQTRLLMEALRKECPDVEVVVSAFAGLQGAEIEWNGWRILPGGAQAFGVDTLPSYIQTERPDLVLTLMDTYRLGPIAGELKALCKRGAGRPVLACWMPIDCTPLGRYDAGFIADVDAVPIAMSAFGKRQLEDAGIRPVPLIPHAVDTTRFKPSVDRARLRAEFGLDPGAYVIGILAANRDAIRKGLPEQMQAYAMFRENMPDSVLLMHTLPRLHEGHDLTMVAAALGIGEHVRFADDFAQVSGIITDDALSDWYGTLDLLSSATYGEGFCVPVIEAMACGTPALMSAHSAMTELEGFKIHTERFWNGIHGAWWGRPSVHEIYRQYLEHGSLGAVTRDAYREHLPSLAARYSIAAVFHDHWLPFLDQYCGYDLS